MTIKALNKSEIEKVYQVYLKEDFPKDELKPLEYIVKMYDFGKYECLGFYDGETFAGYAYMVIPDGSNVRLLDYFAVLRGQRNNGIGGECLKALKKYYKDLKCVILESEHPAYSKDDEDKKIRDRRISFYKRNGLIETDLTTSVGGVYYKIICMECSADISEIDIKREVENIYYTMFGSCCTKKYEIMEDQ